MLPIYICEHDEFQLAYFKKLISDTIMIESMDASIVCSASSPYHLLSCLSEYPTPALYFLPIKLNTPMDGFALAQKIRKQDPYGFIVFITTHSELSCQSSHNQIDAMDYLLKDEPNELVSKIHCCIQKALEGYTLPANTVPKAITLKVDERIISLRLNDIYCIQTSCTARKIRIYKRNGYTELFYSLTEIEELLNDSFFKCHKSCIINLNYVKEVNRKESLILLDNGKVCPVSARIIRTLTSKLPLSHPESLHK